MDEFIEVVATEAARAISASRKRAAEQAATAKAVRIATAQSLNTPQPRVGLRSPDEARIAAVAALLAANAAQSAPNPTRASTPTPTAGPSDNPLPDDPFASPQSPATRAVPPAGPSASARLLAAFAGPSALLSGIVLAEALGPPVSMREDGPKSIF